MQTRGYFVDGTSTKNDQIFPRFIIRWIVINTKMSNRRYLLCLGLIGLPNSNNTKAEHAIVSASSIYHAWGMEALNFYGADARKKMGILHHFHTPENLGKAISLQPRTTSRMPPNQLDYSGCIGIVVFASVRHRTMHL